MTFLEGERERKKPSEWLPYHYYYYNYNNNQVLKRNTNKYYTRNIHYVPLFFLFVCPITATFIDGLISSYIKTCQLQMTLDLQSVSSHTLHPTSDAQTGLPLPHTAPVILHLTPFDLGLS